MDELMSECWMKETGCRGEGWELLTLKARQRSGEVSGWEAVEGKGAASHGSH